MDRRDRPRRIRQFWNAREMYRVALVIGAFFLNASCSPQDFNEVSSRKASDDEGPLVVILGGSEGGYPHVPLLIREFRSRGISVAEVAYFDFPNGPRHLQEISIDAVSERIAALGQPHNCIGILGISKGAELALLLAAYQPVSDVTVAMVPSNVVWQSSRISLRNTSSWTIGGRSLDFVPYKTLSIMAVRAAMDYNKALPLHMAALGNTKAVQGAVIPVERIDQPVLLQSALNDQIWPSSLMASQIIDRVESFGVEHQITHISYDHDHFLLGNGAAVSDLLEYLSSALDQC
jgi:esterase/lipase